VKGVLVDEAPAGGGRRVALGDFVSPDEVQDAAGRDAGAQHIGALEDAGKLRGMGVELLR